LTPTNYFAPPIFELAKLV